MTMLPPKVFGFPECFFPDRWFSTVYCPLDRPKFPNYVVRHQFSTGSFSA
jgi:hypothetical protein